MALPININAATTKTKILRFTAQPPSSSDQQAIAFASAAIVRRTAGYRIHRKYDSGRPKV
jgi:phosphotransferase system IIB component